MQRQLDRAQQQQLVALERSTRSAYLQPQTSEIHAYSGDSEYRCTGCHRLLSMCRKSDPAISGCCSSSSSANIHIRGEGWTLLFLDTQCTKLFVQDNAQTSDALPSKEGKNLQNMVSNGKTTCLNQQTMSGVKFLPCVTTNQCAQPGSSFWSAPSCSDSLCSPASDDAV